MTASLVLERLCVSYGPRRVLVDLSLEVAGGEVVALVGPNGAGKSTALRAAGGLIAPESGRVAVCGRDLPAWRRRELARVLAVVSQFPTLPALSRVRDYVALGRTPHVAFLGAEGRADWEAVAAALALAGVAELAERRLDALSGGERQRVAIARALAQEPSVLLLDEPTANLDLKYQDAILSLLRRLAAERRLACLIVLHDLSLAGQYCDRVCLLADGRRVGYGAPAQVLDAGRLSAVYDTPLEVLRHPRGGFPVVVHGRELESETRS